MSGTDIVPPPSQSPSFEALAYRIGNNEAAVAALARDVREGREATEKAIGALGDKLSGKGLSWPVLISSASALAGLLYVGAGMAAKPYDVKLEHLEEVARTAVPRNELEEKWRLGDRRFDQLSAANDRQNEAMAKLGDRIEAKLDALRK